MAKLDRKPLFRRALFALATLALVAYGWLAVQVYRAQKAPESFEAWNGKYSWIVGPKAADLTSAAEDRLQDGIAALNDRDLPVPERFAKYNESLAGVEELLLRSLRANPAQANTLAGLAATRFEVSPPATAEQLRRLLGTIDLASSMAPRVPNVQQQLGELLLAMGRRDEALTYFSRTVELDPGRSRDLVNALTDSMVPIDEILAALPRTAEVLAAARPEFAAQGRRAEYIDLVEAEGRFDAAPIFYAYADACIRAGEPDRLVRTLAALDELDDPALEALRQAQLSLGYMRVEDHPRAISAAERAVKIQPENYLMFERLGDAAAAAGEHDYALSALNDALRKHAIASAAPLPRARLYRKIGEVEQSRGRPDRAYDAYQRALATNPEDKHARRLLAEFELPVDPSR